jgi:predicted transcriptional regulator
VAVPQHIGKLTTTDWWKLKGRQKMTIKWIKITKQWQNNDKKLQKFTKNDKKLQKMTESGTVGRPMVVFLKHEL